jgi:hypothetical protein
MAPGGQPEWHQSASPRPAQEYHPPPPCAHGHGKNLDQAFVHALANHPPGSGMPLIGAHGFYRSVKEAFITGPV